MKPSGSQTTILELQSAAPARNVQMNVTCRGGPLKVILLQAKFAEDTSPTKEENSDTNPEKYKFPTIQVDFGEKSPLENISRNRLEVVRSSGEHYVKSYATG